MSGVYESDGVWPSAGGTKGSDSHERSNGHARPGACESDWPEPIPLGMKRELPAFPVHVLPDWLRDWVEAEAVATQTPPDMAAMLGLCALSTCCARRLRVRMHGDWSQPVNLYAVVVLPPANRKSAVFRDAVAPLDAFVCEQIKQLAPDIRSSKDALTVAQKRLENAIKRAANQTTPEAQFRAQFDVDSARAALTQAELEFVVAPRLTCGDVTQEALATLLEQNGERIAVMDAEGCGPIALMLGRYTEGTPNVDVYLRAHDGDVYRADRMHRPPVVLNAPAITLAITVQPEVLRQLGARRELRGLGLLARILWCVPVSTVGRRSSEPPPMPDAVRDAYDRRIRGLLELPQPTGEDDQVAAFNSEAWRQLRTFTDRLEPELGPGGELEHVADWAGKLTGAVARLAGLLHAAKYESKPWSVPVAADTVVQAIGIGEYLLAHARAALAAMGADPGLEDAQRVLDWLLAHNVEDISRRELHRAMQSRFPRVSALDVPLAVLGEHGWIRIIEAPAPGAAPRGVLHVQLNPAARAAATGRGH